MGEEYSVTNKQPNVSRIKVRLSRILSWGEVEYLRNQFNIEMPRLPSKAFDRSVFIVTMHNRGSRRVFSDFAECLAEEFVNVFPVHVKTLAEADHLATIHFLKALESTSSRLVVHHPPEQQRPRPIEPTPAPKPADTLFQRLDNWYRTLWTR